MNKSINTKYYVGMVAAMLVWGIAWTVGKVAVEHSNPDVCAFWRYFITFFSMLPILYILKIPLKTTKLGFVFMLLGGFLTAFFNYFFFTGVSYGQAGYGGTVVTSLSPIITYILSIAIFKTDINLRQIIALCIGAIGAAILMRIPFDGLAVFNQSVIYFIICAFLWSIITIVAQKASNTAHPMFYVTGVFGFTMLFNLLFAMDLTVLNIYAYDSTFWLTIAFTGLVSGTFGMTVYFLSAAKVGAHNTGIFMFIVPVGAILSSFFIYHESVMPSTLIGCLLAFCAVVLFNTKSKIR
ncbi:MAG: hypothetical protein RL154_1046 [Pseudomonadota bacterium]|jgi:drug/metabolite transporter (DMT)-like permease